MGSAIGKDNNNNDSNNSSVDTPVGKGKLPDNVSPLYAIAASLNQGLYEDPRSPGSKRTPVHTPFESPCVTPTTARRYGRVIMRLNSASKFGGLDPRSPASKRTPLHEYIANEVKATPPPFSLGDPRSPMGLERTPLALSAADDVVIVPDDVVIATEEIIYESVALSLDESEVKQELVEEKAEEVKQEAENIQQASAAAESTSEKVTTEFFSSPDYSPSPAIMALAMSPLNSPIGARKRKDRARVIAHSPLKKSYSAPIDENDLPNPPSPLNKPLKRSAQLRTPLSPISQRNINSRHCMEVQPIKLRMDPTILG